MVFPVAMKRELRLTFQNTLDLRMVYASVREYVFEILASQICQGFKKCVEKSMVMEFCAINKPEDWIERVVEQFGTLVTANGFTVPLSVGNNFFRQYYLLPWLTLTSNNVLDRAK